MKIALCLVALILMKGFSLGQMKQLPDAKQAGTEEIFQAASELTKAADLADQANEDAIRYCGTTKSKTTKKTLENAIAENLLAHDSSLQNYIPASKIWMVADIADSLEFSTALSMPGCAHYFNADFRAQKTSFAVLEAFEALARAKYQLQKLALRQTIWEERQNQVLQEQ